MKKLIAASVVAAGILCGCVVSINQPAAATKASPPQWNVCTQPFDVTTRAADVAKDPLSFVAGSWTLVVIPDVQNYNDVEGKKNPVEGSMLRWIAVNHERRNIRMVLTTGDITNHDVPSEWANARAAFAALDGKVPYVMATGNHDYARSSSRATRLNDSFQPAQNPLNDPAKGGALGGTFEGGIENAWYKFEAGGKKYVVLSLEFAPRDMVVEWAKYVAAQQTDARLILLTHAYLYADNTRYDFQSKGKTQKYSPHQYALSTGGEAANDGQELWDKLVKHGGNFKITINGHVMPETAYLASKADRGNVVHQMMYNRQKEDDGQLRLLEFLPDNRTVRVKTYSPVTDAWATDPANQFIMDLDASDETTATRPAGER